MEKLNTALIGSTGFVGSNLRRHAEYDQCYNSKDIQQICGRSFGTVTCAGISANKWWANKNADEDRRQIDVLYRALKYVSCDRFILISTVDVFREPVGVYETDEPTSTGLHPYGSNRLDFENRVRDLFPKVYVVRLPGVFGDGLKKNVIYDLLRLNRVDSVLPNSYFQWYPVDRLHCDIETALSNELTLLHLAVPPLHTGTMVKDLFPNVEISSDHSPGAFYDFRTKHSKIFNETGGYIISSDRLIAMLRAFVERQCG
jgi:hypothetical protein